MESLTSFGLQEKYARVKQIRPQLEKIKSLLNWNAFLKIFPDTTADVGRPRYDYILMIRTLFLQSWYSISDEEVEYQIYDRLSFQQFLDYPKQVPDYTTIWRFREYLTEQDFSEKIWSELQHQIDASGVKIEKGVIQDASFIDADPGKKSGMEGRGREAKTSRNADATWTKKADESHFGYKMHTLVGKETKLIRELAITTAKTYDGNVDLASQDQIVYRDRGYSGSGTRAKGDASMKRGKITPHELLRNKRISRQRCRGEHPFGTMVRSFKAGHTRLTTLARVYVQQLFVCAAYNLNRLKFLLEN